MAYRIEVDEAPGDAVRRVAAERVESALEDLSNTDAPVDWRIHQLRKRCKETRSLVRLVRTGFPDYSKVNKSFRKIARRVSSHRDARVTADLVRKLAAVGDDQQSPENNPVVRWFEFRARMAEQVAEPKLARIRELLADAAVDIESWPVSDIRVDDVVEGLWRTLARVNETTEALREGGSLHEWRKRCKDLLYQLRILENVLPTGKEQCIEQFDKLAELIGEAHDCRVLADHLDEQPPFLHDTLEARHLTVVAMQEQRDLETRAMELCDELLEYSLEEFTDSVASKWRNTATPSIEPPGKSAGNLTVV